MDALEFVVSVESKLINELTLINQYGIIIAAWLLSCSNDMTQVTINNFNSLKNCGKELLANENISFKL